MSRMLSKMNLISVVQQLPKEDIEIIQGYIGMIEEENKQLKDNWNKLKEYLNYKSERAVGEDEYVYDEIYNEMQELEQGSDDNEIT